MQYLSVLLIINQINIMEMIEIVQIIGLFLGFGGWILIMVSLEDQYWKESTTEGSVITTSTIYENLWMSCASDSTGIYNCRDFPSLFALPGKTQSRRTSFTTEMYALCVRVEQENQPMLNCLTERYLKTILRLVFGMIYFD